MPIPNLLSLNFLVPFVAAKLDFSRAVRGLRGMPRRVLLIGHRSGTGSLALNTIVTVTSESDALQRLGEGSMLMQMWRAAKANVDVGMTLDVIAIAQGGSAVAANSTLVITNAAGSSAVLQQAGEVMLYIAGQRISIGVSTADTQATVATKLIAAINAVPSLPVTAASTANTNECKITANWGGTTGNDIDVRNTYYFDDRMPQGLTMTTPAMASGAVTPDVTPVITAMQGYRATEIVCPFTDSTNLGLMEAELATRWGANNMQDGQLVNAIRGTESAITTFLSSRNSAQVHTITTTKDATSPWETAAMAGARGESMAAIDPAVPHVGAVLSGYRGPSAGNHWTVDQQNNMLLAGGCPLIVYPDYTGALGRMVTNYTQTASGSPDRSMAELCWIKTMSYYRWLHITEFAIKYEGYKLAPYIDEPIPGQKIMTPELGQEIMLGLYQQLREVGLVQNLDYYRQTLVVEVDAPNGKLKIQDEPVLVTQHYQTEITTYVVAGAV